jgi:hypothetical protein
MDRIKVFKGKVGLAKFFVIFGIFFTLVGLTLFIMYVIAGFNFHFPSGDWNSVLFIFQGMLFIIMGGSYLKNREYFIEWDDRELRFLLPDTKVVETIKIAEIQSVNIKLFEIELKLIDGFKTLNLENLQFEDIKKIKEKFEKIQTKN